MNLYVMVGDKPQGPLSLDQLRGLMRDGMVNMQTLAWMDGQGEWVPLGSLASVVAELFPPLPNGAGRTLPPVEPWKRPSSEPPVPDPVASSSTPTNGVTTSSIDGGEMFALVALLVLVAVYLLAGSWSHYKVGLLIGTAIAMQPMGSSRQPRIRNGLLGFGIAQFAVAGVYYLAIHSQDSMRVGPSATSISPEVMRPLALGVISLVIWLAVFMSIQRGQRSNARTS